MPAPYIFDEDPENEWSLSNWKESIGLYRPGGTGNFSGTDAQDVIQIEVPYNKVRSCLRQLFGYSVADGASPWKLNRPEIPVQHPIYPWLWATSASVQPWSPLPRRTGEEESAPLKARTDTVTWAGSSQYNSSRYTTNWMRANVSVVFEPIHYRVYADTDPAWGSLSTGSNGGEFNRFLSYERADPRNEVITANAAENPLFFAETSAAAGFVAAGPTPGPTGTPIPANAMYTFKQTVEFNIWWLRVEESFIVDTSDPNYFVLPLPKRLLSHLGTVNKTEFFKHKIGTLLFNGIILKRYSQPVVTNSEWGAPAYDIGLKFLRFDPKKSPIVTGAPSGSVEKFGWHLFPHRRNNYWYFASKGTGGSAGTYDGQTMIIESEFRDMFKHWSDPTAYP